MGQEVRGVPETPPLEGSPEPSIGAYLARQRRLRGIAIEELAERTRIPLRSLERLEEGAFDSQSDGFARGFVRTVAEGLGLDPDETVMRLLAEPGGDEDDSAGRADLRPWAAAAAGLALVAVAVAVGIWLLAGTLIEPAGDEASGVVYRHDAVKDLADRSRAEEPDGSR